MGNRDRRLFERESVNIPFIYSIDDGTSINDGEWQEAVTLDIGPVLVGGLAFHSSEPLEIGYQVRIALFMDLTLLPLWKRDPEGFPAVYHGKVCRVEPSGDQYRIAVTFQELENSAFAHAAEGGVSPDDTR